jgi:hypothetical protein
MNLIIIVGILVYARGNKKKAPIHGGMYRTASELYFPNTTTLLLDAA